MKARQRQITDAADAWSIRRYGRDDEMQASFADAFSTGALWADETPAWTSVDDALPPIDEHVLICTSIGGVLVGKYHPVKSYQFLGVTSGAEFVMTKVTHWMPLPPPPGK